MHSYLGLSCPLEELILYHHEISPCISNNPAYLKPTFSDIQTTTTAFSQHFHGISFSIILLSCNPCYYIIISFVNKIWFDSGFCIFFFLNPDRQSLSFNWIVQFFIFNVIIDIFRINSSILFVFYLSKLFSLSSFLFLLSR